MWASGFGLLQQYFFVSCSLQHVLHIMDDLAEARIRELPERFALQLNDTHPSIGVAELMRLLVDERQLDWDEAWDITVATFGYTNHTLLPEALETWPLAMFGESLPRHLEIIYEINRRFLDEVRAKFPGDDDRLRRMSLIGEDGGKCVRMAHLATVGSHADQRRRRAALPTAQGERPEGLLRDVAGAVQQQDQRRHAAPVPGAGEPGAARAARRHDRRRLADRPGPARGARSRTPTTPRSAAGGAPSSARTRRGSPTTCKATTGVELNPDWLFDIQVKRIHEYKRQHLNVLHIVTLYHRIKNNPGLEIPPRAFIFGGKAAPGYFVAKRIIKLINAVADTVNSDPDVNRVMKVAFIPNFNVQNAHLIYPAADLSEQISTAGKEASGTGNMKFMINGALTIGTLDGANVEIRDEVGAENFFLFGLTEDQVRAGQARRLPADGLRRPQRGTQGRTATHCAAAAFRAVTPTSSAPWSTICATTTRSWCSPTTRPTSNARAGSARPGGTPTRGRGCRS